MNVVFSYATIFSGIGDETLKKIIVIGGGASGMVSAIAAARCGADVTIIEHMDRIGKKILSTGNGKCNYTNRKQGLRYYRGETPAFVLPVFEQFGFAETVEFFRELGVYPKEKNGCLYPASEQASAVLDVLRLELARLQVHIVTNCRITDIQKTKKGFQVQTNCGPFFSNSCIFACGGKAFPKSGSDGSAFPYIEKFGHTIIDLVPALVQMKAKQSFFKAFAGIRSDILVTLYVNNVRVCQDRGEVQLTEFGISGIPSFQVSRYAARALNEHKKVTAALDFAPFLSEEELYRELEKRFLLRGEGKDCTEALIGLFQKKLIPVFLKENRISLQTPAKKISKSDLKRLSEYCKHMKIDITDTKGFECAQVSAGGVSTAEISSSTMESFLVPGLYFAGEAVDIDGMCGGYNLQWAWSSGYVAGIHAAEQE